MRTSKRLTARIMDMIQADLDKQVIPRLHLYYGHANPNVVCDHSPASVNTSAMGQELLRPFFSTCMNHHEQFWLLLLNIGNKVIGAVQVSSGGLSATVADPKMIFGAALCAQASGIILAHNHPSGTLRPSEEDIILTRKLVEASRLLQMKLMDHLILTTDGYFSFADNGML